MADSEELLGRLVAATEEQLRWQRAAALPQVREIVDTTLVKSKMRQAYELLDGERQSSDIAATVGTSKGNMSGWARRWRDLGIAYDTTNAKGHKRIKHLMSLEALGVPLEVEED
jgi:hypothetical protein